LLLDFSKAKQLSKAKSLAFGFRLFLKGHRADELSTPEFSFHRCRASREVEGHGANPNTISPEKYNGGRENYNSNSNNT
jgi:hypothetical protein